MAYRSLPSGPPYKLLVLQMDNSIFNLFNYAMLTVASNCRTKTHGYDHKPLAILFEGLKTQCYTQHQMHIQNI